MITDLNIVPDTASGTNDNVMPNDAIVSNMHVILYHDELADHRIAANACSRGDVLIIAFAHELGAFQRQPIRNGLDEFKIRPLRLAGKMS